MNRRGARLTTGTAAAVALVVAIPLAVGMTIPKPPLRHDPVVVESPVVVAGAVVRGAGRDWTARGGPPPLGEPVPVELTAYCLQGTTRRGRWVRHGIVAADPRYFPLSRYVEVYVGTRYLGRFLVDDTGGKIVGAKLDVWMASCREARLFGRVKGTAVLVPRPDIEVIQAGSKGATR